MEQSQSFNHQFPSYQQVSYRQTAFHQAAHVAAICLGNKQRQLPPVFFEIRIKRPQHKGETFVAKVVDGQLIQSLCATPLEKINTLSTTEKQNYKSAYEADTMNLLVGSLAEERYIAEHNQQLINKANIQSKILKHFEHSSDVEKAWQYLENIFVSQANCEEKMQEIFDQAFQFISYNPHWNAINHLVDYIFASSENTISCEESIKVFDQALGLN